MKSVGNIAKICKLGKALKFNSEKFYFLDIFGNLNLMRSLELMELFAIREHIFFMKKLFLSADIFRT